MEPLGRLVWQCRRGVHQSEPSWMFQGGVRVAAVNCGLWGPGCMLFFFNYFIIIIFGGIVVFARFFRLYDLSKTFGPECLRWVLHVLFPQSPTTPYCLRPGLGFLVFPLPAAWSLSASSWWPLLESSPPLGSVAGQREGLLFTFLFCTGPGGAIQLDHTGPAEELTVQSRKWHAHKRSEHCASKCLQKQLWEGQWLEHTLPTHTFVGLVHRTVAVWAKMRQKQPSGPGLVLHPWDTLWLLLWVPAWVTSTSPLWASDSITVNWRWCKGQEGCCLKKGVEKKNAYENA